MLCSCLARSGPFDTTLSVIASLFKQQQYCLGSQYPSRKIVSSACFSITRCLILHLTAF